MDPIRERRQKFANNPDQINQILIDGTSKAREAAKITMDKVRRAMKIDYFLFSHGRI